MLALLLLSGCMAPSAALTQAEELAFIQHPGAKLPLDGFRDTDGNVISLYQAAAGRPLLVVLGYFACQNLCPVTRASLYRALANANLQAGRDYSLAAVSIDPQESLAAAQRARSQDVAEFSPGSSAAIHYLTADPGAIAAVSSAVGFRDRWDGGARQFLHPAGVVFVTKAGTISSYLLGVGYRASAVREAWRRASGESAAPVYATPILLLCFRYDGSTGRYTLASLRLLRLAAIGCVLVLGGILLRLLRSERRGA